MLDGASQILISDGSAIIEGGPPVTLEENVEELPNLDSDSPNQVASFSTNTKSTSPLKWGLRSVYSCI